MFGSSRQLLRDDAGHRCERGMRSFVHEKVIRPRLADSVAGDVVAADRSVSGAAWVAGLIFDRVLFSLFPMD